jgi:hypothetical protein
MDLQDVSLVTSLLRVERRQGQISVSSYVGTLNNDVCRKHLINLISLLADFQLLMHRQLRDILVVGFDSFLKSGIMKYDRSVQ